MPQTVFISQTRASLPDSYRMAESLKRDHAKVFMSADSESIPAGDSWLSSVIEGLKRCTDFFLLISKREEDGNRWLLFEIGYAKGRDLTPKVFLKGVSRDELGNLKQIEPQFFTGFDVNEVDFESGRAHPSAREADDVFVMYDPASESKAKFFDQLCVRSLRTRKLVALTHPPIESLDQYLGSKSSLLIIITSIEDLHNQWLPYWIGFAKGRGAVPKILVQNGAWNRNTFPDVVREFHLIDTGDTNRWLVSLQQALDIEIDKAEEGRFADFFGQSQSSRR